MSEATTESTTTAEGGAATATGTASTDDGKAYTAPASQADLDRIINERLARERAKFADHADLKAKAARLAEIEAANATETEKAVTKAREEGKAEVLTVANARLVNAEVRALAAAAKFRDPTDAIAQLSSRLGEVKVSDDGEVDGAAIKTLLDDLARTKPYLLDATSDDGSATVAASLDLGTRGGTGKTGDPATDFAKILQGQIGP